MIALDNLYRKIILHHTDMITHDMLSEIASHIYDAKTLRSFSMTSRHSNSVCSLRLLHARMCRELLKTVIPYLSLEYDDIAMCNIIPHELRCRLKYVIYYEGIRSLDPNQCSTDERGQIRFLFKTPVTRVFYGKVLNKVRDRIFRKQEPQFDDLTEIEWM